MSARTPRRGFLAASGAFLAASAALPLAGAPAAVLAPPGGTAELLDLIERAERLQAAVDAARGLPDDAMDAACDRIDALLWQIVERPAAGLPDLAVKARAVELFFRWQQDDFDTLEEALPASLATDVLALLG